MCAQLETRPDLFYQQTIPGLCLMESIATEMHLLIPHPRYLCNASVDLSLAHCALGNRWILHSLFWRYLIVDCRLQASFFNLLVDKDSGSRAVPGRPDHVRNPSDRSESALPLLHHARRNGSFDSYSTGDSPFKLTQLWLYLLAFPYFLELIVSTWQRLSYFWTNYLILWYWSRLGEG